MSQERKHLQPSMRPLTHSLSDLMALSTAAAYANGDAARPCFQLGWTWPPWPLLVQFFQIQIIKSSKWGWHLGFLGASRSRSALVAAICHAMPGTGHEYDNTSHHSHPESTIVLGKNKGGWTWLSFFWGDKLRNSGHHTS